MPLFSSPTFAVASRSSKKEDQHQGVGLAPFFILAQCARDNNSFLPAHHLRNDYRRLMHFLLHTVQLDYAGREQEKYDQLYRSLTLHTAHDPKRRVHL